MFIDDVLANPDHTIGEDVLGAVRGAVVLGANNVFSYLCDKFGFNDPTRHITPDELRKVFPNVAPIAPMCWVEYICKIGEGPGFPVGTLLIYDNKDGGGWDVHFCVWHRNPDGKIISPDVVVTLSVSGDGRLSERGQQRFRVGITPERCTGERAEVTVVMSWVAFAAMTFAHCKGVTLTDHRAPEKVQHARSRRGKPPLVTYKTLDIGQVDRVLREGAPGERHLGKALHICRGHFAHYTEEKPLFGRHVGTVFVPMHVRGSLEHGSVEKTYRVKATNS